MLGLEGLKQEGIKQNQAGKEMEAQGQLSDLGSGVADRYAAFSIKHLVLLPFLICEGLVVVIATRILTEKFQGQRCCW